MILNWMAYAALCAALFGLAAASIDSLFAGRRRARRGVWIVAIAASIIVPVALPFLSSMRKLPVAPALVAEVQQTSASVAPASTSFDVVVLVLWGLASLLFALSLLIAHRRTTLALRRCRAGTIGGRAAFVSQDFGPAVVGLLRHHIVVPAWTLVLDPTEQELVVAHELEHARSGDPLLALAGVCAVVAMPWNVALWWQLARLRLAIELDCDARVIAHDHDALLYTRLLLSVGERVRGARHPVLAMSRSRSALAKRFDALLRRDVIDPRRAVGLVVLAAGMLASVAFVPAPSVSEIVKLVRPAARAEAVVSAPLAGQPAGRVDRGNVVSGAAASPAEPIVQRAPRAPSARRRTLAANVDVSRLPPVSVVPPAANRNTLDSVVVARAVALPTMRFMGGVITAAPGGGGGGARGRGGRGGFISRPATGGADSNVVSARGGGRAVLVPRPDSIRPPR